MLCNLFVANSTGWGGFRRLTEREGRGGMNRRAAATAVRYRGAREVAAGTGRGNRKVPGNSNTRMESLGHRGPGNKGSRRGSGCRHR